MNSRTKEERRRGEVDLAKETVAREAGEPPEA